MVLMVKAQSQLIASLVSGCANHSSLEAKPRPHKQTTVLETFLPFCGRWYVELLSFSRCLGDSVDLAKWRFQAKHLQFGGNFQQL